MKKIRFGKFVAAALLCFVLITAFSSCIYLDDIRPKNSETENSSQSSAESEQSDSSGAGDESSTGADVSTISADESSGGESSRDESSETSEPPTVKSYDYNGFHIVGFEMSEIITLVSSLTSIIGNAGAEVGIYYEELDTGYSISYNKEKKFCSGSVIKAPYAMYLMSSDIDLNQKLTLQANQKMEGSGIIKDNAAGTSYTIEKLIEYSIVNSDNTAYRMLYDCFEFGSFNMYTYEFGIDTGCSSSEYLGYLGFISAYEAGVLFKDIYRRSKTNEAAGRLLGYLSDTQYSYLLPAGITNHTVAHKYGYMTGSYKVLNDVGIVLDTHPYIIAILTDINPSGGNGRSTFKSLASAINGFHDNLSQ
ncbi:MAG: class A beta-lactamase-related serine hydrolase [Eubacteriales bacterium]|nr:class A beta-lactamase-related serine hydrolase [Eubacteriales bacterium]